jgi:hypothetical protein
MQTLLHTLEGSVEVLHVLYNSHSIRLLKAFSTKKRGADPKPHRHFASRLNSVSLLANLDLPGDEVLRILLMAVGAKGNTLHLLPPPLLELLVAVLTIPDHWFCWV